MEIHFISIGGPVMHNLAIALHRKGYRITGSDQEIFEPARSALEENGLLPEKEGWDPGRIHPGIDAVILGINARKNNRELKRALELGIRIYSFPEYIYEQSKDKKRIVIGGTHGKTTITAMVMHALRQQGMDFDYLVSSRIRGFEDMVRLTDDSPFIIMEGDEYLPTPVDRIPIFHQYNPHMTLLSGIAWDHMNVFRTFDCYKKTFQKFLRIATGGGKVFYYEGDPVLGEVVDRSHWSLLKIPYGEHPYRIEDNRFILETKYGSVPLNLIGQHNMQNIMGALLVCRELGLEDHLFYSALQTFKGSERRQQLLANNNNRAVFLDFAQAPSSVEATVTAFKQAYYDQKVVTCLELNTYCSLNREYMPLYKGSLEGADRAIVYYNPAVVRQKRLPELSPEEIRDHFGKEELAVYNDTGLLEEDLKQLDENTCILLLMTSGNYNGLDLQRLASEVVSPS